MNTINTTARSIELFNKAKQHIPGGVNSPVRAFKSVGGDPIFMIKASGAYMYDVDDNKYIDYINSWGPMILGHGHPKVVAAIQKQATQALTLGTPTELEVRMAEQVKSMVPNIELIRLVNSGTEACMSALRLARGYTGRNKFIKFEGCYHGHADPFLQKAGSGLATLNNQDVPGVTVGSSQDSLTATFNNLQSVKALFENYKDQIAAIIIEPVAGNMGCIPPVNGFLEGLRMLCDTHGAVLIFDEVMTGFRVSEGGAQQRFGVLADLVTYGKIIGGGMPIGAFGGKKEIMDCLAPQGKVYQAGTLSGNPIAVSAGITTLSILKEHPEIYKKLEQTSKQLEIGMSSIFIEKGIDHTIHNVGSMISVFFGDSYIENFTDVVKTDIKLYNRFFHHMLKKGVYLPPSGFESWFLSTALRNEDIDYTLQAIKEF